MTAANRYATALFGLAEEAKSQPETSAAVTALAAALEDSSVASTLANPRLTPAQRTQLANAMVKATKAPTLLANTLGLLAANNRLRILPQVLKAYLELTDAANSVTHVQLSSATALSEAQRTKITELLKKQTHSTSIRLEETLDPNLQGGFRAFFNGLVWDASLSGQLARIGTRLRTAIAQRQA